MSDGMRDCSVTLDLYATVKDAADKLREAMQEAEIGHRGLSVDAVSAANDSLLPFGFRVQKLVTKEEWR